MFLFRLKQLLLLSLVAIVSTAILGGVIVAGHVLKVKSATKIVNVVLAVSRSCTDSESNANATAGGEDVPDPRGSLPINRTVSGAIGDDSGLLVATERVNVPEDGGEMAAIFFLHNDWQARPYETAFVKRFWGDKRLASILAQVKVYTYGPGSPEYTAADPSSGFTFQGVTGDVWPTFVLQTADGTRRFKISGQKALAMSPAALSGAVIKSIREINQGVPAAPNRGVNPNVNPNLNPNQYAAAPQITNASDTECDRLFKRRPRPDRPFRKPCPDKNPNVDVSLNPPPVGPLPMLPDTVADEEEAEEELGFDPVWLIVIALVGAPVAIGIGGGLAWLAGVKKDWRDSA